MNKFIELTVTTTHIGGELVSDVLWGYTDSGVVISDIEDVIALARDGRAWDYADESIFKADKTVLVKAYFPTDSAKETLALVERDLEQMKVQSPLDLGTLETAKREIDGDLWREQWKEHFKPIKLGKVVIVPEWIEYKASKDELVVLLDSIRVLYLPYHYHSFLQYSNQMLQILLLDFQVSILDRLNHLFASRLHLL